MELALMLHIVDLLCLIWSVKSKNTFVSNMEILLELDRSELNLRLSASRY